MADLAEALRRAVPDDAVLPELDDLRRRADRRRTTTRRIRFGLGVSLAVLVVMGAVLAVERRETGSVDTPPTTIAARSLVASRMALTGLDVSVFADPSDPIVARVTRRLDDVNREIERTGQAENPPECYPVAGFTIEASGPIEPPEASGPLEPAASPLTGKDATAAVTALSSFLAPIPSDPGELVVIAHSADATATIDLLQGGLVIDHDAQGTGWAILVAPVPQGFSFDRGMEDLDLQVRASGATAPLVEPERAGEYC